MNVKRKMFRWSDQHVVKKQCVQFQKNEILSKFQPFQMWKWFVMWIMKNHGDFDEVRVNNETVIHVNNERYKEPYEKWFRYVIGRTFYE